MEGETEEQGCFRSPSRSRSFLDRSAQGANAGLGFGLIGSPLGLRVFDSITTYKALLERREKLLCP